MIDINAVIEFRNTMNNLIYLRHQLHNYKGKNLWNVVCSAMDWAETAAVWLAHYPSPRLEGNQFLDSMNVCFYISAVDMLYQGVNQLHAVICNDLENIKNSRLLNRDKRCFKEIGFCEDDISYFKEIRAIFGEHSTDLKLKNLVYQKEERHEHANERWFSSWSFSMGGPPTCTYIYSNDIKKEAVPFSIDINEIQTFALEVYSWVPLLTQKIKNHEERIKEELKQKDWPEFADDFERLRFLKKENEERSGDEGNRLTLEQIELILRCQLNEPCVSKLQEKARILLHRMEFGFRNVIEEDFNLGLHPNLAMPHSVSNAYISLVDLALGMTHNNDLYIWKASLLDFISSDIIIPDGLRMQDLYVLITAALFQKAE